MSDMSNFAERVAKLSPRRLALLAMELHDRVEAAEQCRKEPLAIVGLGCRFPGGANGPDNYWRMLREGTDAIQEVPSDRWDIDAYYDPDPDTPGKMATRWGGFLDDVDRFDAEFFGISPREAAGMDPQQRMLLEVAWQALEHAGISPHALKESRTGVYVGILSGDYFQLQVSRGAHAADTYLATGGSNSVASGRLSYFLGLKGPAMSIDTACSSSLMAVHLACRSLRDRECNVALAAGVNTLLWPEGTVTMSRGRMMAPDGRCKTFDARADGFVRGEGCGVVVIKRLADAEADDDRVLAVIRGSATNQDGRSNGLTAPNGPSQQAVIRAALADGGVRPSEVSYVEAHGTGTPLGDPIEVQALATVLAEGRPESSPVMLGSVKTNLGHLEAASGIAGLIKVVLAFGQRQIPAHLHFENPSPHIDWRAYPVRVPTVLTPWNPPAGPRIAGVSSFGFSGSNVHVVLEEAPVRPEVEPGNDRPVQLLPLSARSSSALDALLGSYGAHLEGTKATLADITHTAGVHRAHFSHRIAIVGESREEVAEKIRGIGSGVERMPGVARGGPAPAGGPPIVFLFAGQGAQQVGMARQLYETHPTFRTSLDRCDEILRSFIEIPLRSIIYPEATDDAALLRETQYTQPALFAMEYALAELWRSWGVEPAALVGHSLGEYVAACVAGVFDLEAGLRLVSARGRLSQDLPGAGAMAAVFLGAAEVASELEPFGDRVTVAAVNGPENTVISGERDAVEAILSALTARGVESRPLEVSYAGHSPMVDPMLEAFLGVASDVEYHDPEIELYSTLTGRLVGDEVRTASYWQRHVRAPVQFWPAMSSLHEDGYRVFLEVGPHSTLLGLGRQCLPPGYGTWLPSLRRDRPDWVQLMETLAELYVQGVDPNWAEFDREFERRRVVVPTYPFQRERHWISQLGASSAASVIAPARGESALGHRTDSARGDVIYESLIALSELPFLDDHRMSGRIVAPAPLFLERAMAAGEDALDEREVEVLDLELLAPMIMGADEDRVLQVVVRLHEDVRARVEIFSRSSTEAPSRVAWTQHVSCSVAGVGAADAEFAADTGTEPAAQSLTSVRDRCKDEVGGEVFYKRLAQRGVEFGPRFQGIRRVLRGSGEALAEIETPDGLRDGNEALGFHPAVLDACLQAFGACVPDPPPGQLYLMSALERYRLVRRPPSDLLSHARVRPASPSDPTALVADVRVLTRSGEVVALIEGMQARPAAALSEVGPRSSPALDWLHEIRWEESTACMRADVAGPAEISEALAPTVEALEGRFRLDDYRDLVGHLEACCVEHVGEAFRQLGWTHDVGRAVSAEALARTWGVPERLHGLLERLLQVLAEEGVLTAADGGWSVRRELPSGPSPDTVREISRRFPDFTGELTLLDRCGRHLADVLRGEQDPLSLLFPGGSTADVEKLTRESPAAQAYNTLIRDSFAAAVAGRRPGDKLRVLEIGAGTGGTTSSILPLLSEDDCAEYVFTDVSPLFVEAARESLDEYGFVAFDLLDIERDPDEQGFAHRRFDVIIAANVLHATRDLRESLANVRKLLAPGGLLVLFEGTAKRRWVDLTFGLTDGWWRFADRDLRPDHPLLSSERWLDLLEEEGFDGSVALSESGVPSNDSHAVVLARKGAGPGNAPAGDRGGRWLILADVGGTGRGLAEHAEGLGHRCVLATPGQRFELVRNGEFTVDPFDPESLDALLRACEQEDGRPPLGVAHLLSIGSPDGRTDPPSDVDAEVSRGCRTALLLTQAMIRRWPDSPPRLWLVTRGAQPAGGEQTLVSPAQAALWGFGRTVAGEHPELWGGLVDLDPFGGEAHEGLLQELLAGDGEDQVALRGGRRFVARLDRLELRGAEVREPPCAAADGTYLVTGATGGVGLHLTRWLADQGARHLALVARREPGEEAERVFEGLREQGVQVSFFRGDVAREAELAEILSGIDDTMPPLRGVYHLAGVFDDAVITQLTWEQFENAFAPKVRGAWNLHVLTRDLSLDVFAIFASAASFLGATGLANYAAANAFQDALAVHRRTLGLPGVSIDWGPWARTGMAEAVGLQREAQWRGGGFDTMPVEAALQALEMVLLGGFSHVAVLPVDWQSHAASLGARTVPPLYQRVLADPRARARGRRPTADGRDGNGERASLDRASLQRLPHEDRVRKIDSFLRSEAAAELGMLAADLDPARPLSDLGFDSLMAVQLRNRVQSVLELNLPVSRFVAGLSVRELAQDLLERLVRSNAGTTAHVAPVTRLEAVSIEDLSDEQVSAMLADLVDAEGGS